METRLVPENLRKAREAMGITRLEASRRMNIPQSSYVRYEIGTRKPTTATIIQMAQVLNTSADYLMGKTDQDDADTVLVRKADNPTLFEISKGASQFDDIRMNRLLEYYKILCENIKEKEK